MRFKTFLKELTTEDKDIKGFVDWVNSLDKFPTSSDPAVLGFFVMDKLSDNLAIGYKKAFLAYYECEDNQLPKSYQDQQSFLDTINMV